jgi:hypothetical protein
MTRCWKKGSRLPPHPPASTEETDSGQITVSASAEKSKLPFACTILFSSRVSGLSSRVFLFAFIILLDLLFFPDFEISTYPLYRI